VIPLLSVPAVPDWLNGSHKINSRYCTFLAGDPYCWIMSVSTVTLSAVPVCLQLGYCLPAHLT